MVAPLATFAQRQEALRAKDRSGSQAVDSAIPLEHGPRHHPTDRGRGATGARYSTTPRDAAWNAASSSAIHSALWALLAKLASKPLRASA